MQCGRVPCGRQIFGDRKVLGFAVHALGQAALALDIRTAPHHDLSDARVLRRVEGWMASGCVASLWLGTPCNSWSRARRGPPESNWPPLRSNASVMGRANLRAADRAKVAAGNRVMRITAPLIRRAISLGIPVYLENPQDSSLWRAPANSRLLDHSGCHMLAFDLCQVGARWRKRTRVATWWSQHSADLSGLGSGHGGLCFRTCKPHITLAGREPHSKLLWTRIAQSYARRLCSSTAHDGGQRRGATPCAAADSGPWLLVILH